MTTWADPQGKVLHDGVSLSPTVCYLQQNHQHILWEKKAFTKAKKKCNKRTYFNSLGTQNERKQLMWLNQALKTALRWPMMYWLYGRIFSTGLGKLLDVFNLGFFRSDDLVIWIFYGVLAWKNYHFFLHLMVFRKYSSLFEKDQSTKKSHFFPGK